MPDTGAVTAYEPGPGADVLPAFGLELAAVGRRLARQEALIALLRAELRQARKAQAAEAGRSGPGHGRRRYGSASGAVARASVLRLARAGAEISVRHGDSGLLNWLYPFVVRTLRYGRRSSLRRLFPWLASLSFAADRSGPGTAPLAPVSPEQALRETSRAVEHGAALASLLGYEVRHVRSGRVERAPWVDVRPEQLVRDGVVVPTEAMLSRLAGRVQPRSDRCLERHRP